MKIYLASANPEEIEKATNLTYLDGVMMNPTLMAEERRDPEDLLEELCDLVDGPVAAQVIGQSAGEMMEQGKRWADISPEIIIKVPMSGEGLKAMKMMKESGIEVLATVVFSINQGLLAAKVGADYVAPYIGRVDKTGFNGIDLIYDLVRTFQSYEFKSKVVAASIKNQHHILESAKAGAWGVVPPFEVLKQMTDHPLTSMG